MEKILLTQEHVIDLLRPETALEVAFIEHPDFFEGLFWGKPRFGHPEGQVLYHIREVLDNIELLNISDQDRDYLRTVTFVHDTFKYKEDRSHPRNWSKHHAVLAKKFLEQFTNNQLLLDLTKYHDEAYHIWQNLFLFQRVERANERLEQFLHRFEGNMQLYYLFFKCDTSTGDKNPAPMKWFEKTMKNINIVDL